ncbi:hypothetical protein [Saccharopolyspora mangrovi]|uniref:Uncharacterized protein n=1 Tax=Saccharopolyspora mangrovi TaxID=3082379 RepID=A0ABU6A747_9PSEU|nr:hypothetical protein [Saccharopolyspora sp. S2-29]MEB3367377.1 hypothetical protein [Saccharopolyspora sp. S2-29]
MSYPKSCPTILCYTHNARLRKALTEVLSPAVVTFSEDKAPPAKANAVVTTGALTLKLERFASQLGCFPVILPEGGEWLWHEVNTNRTMSVLVGADMVKVRL